MIRPLLSLEGSLSRRERAKKRRGWIIRSSSPESLPISLTRIK
jgi:hypothetical protein